MMFRILWLEQTCKKQYYGYNIILVTILCVIGEADLWYWRKTLWTLRWGDLFHLFCFPKHHCPCQLVNFRANLQDYLCYHQQAEESSITRPLWEGLEHFHGADIDLLSVALHHLVLFQGSM